jgi:hypothetical protein
MGSPELSSANLSSRVTNAAHYTLIRDKSKLLIYVKSQRIESTEN